jgi:hypothetical protein
VDEVTQPYPGGFPQGPYPVAPAPYPAPYQVPVVPRYRPLKRLAQVSIVLMGLASLATIVQSILMWRSYDDVKAIVYGLSEDDFERGIESIAGTGPWLDLVSYLLLGTGVAFLIWLWQARENTEFLRFTTGHGGTHRHAQGWLVGAWVCPIVQFWYPLHLVQDVATASEPPQEPGASRTGRFRTLLYGWWTSWTAFWVILVGGGGLAFLGFVVWLIRLVDAADTADATGGYVDIYDLQDFMVRVALAANIGFTVATVLLIAAGVAASLLMLRVTQWQQKQVETPQPAIAAPLPEPPQYAPRYNNPGPTFPSYGR